MKTIEEIINILYAKDKQKNALGKAPYEKKILDFEKKLKIELPNDFKIFYSHFDGFDFKNDDMLNIVPIIDLCIVRNDESIVKIEFAEYLIFCDIWSMTYSKESYSINRDIKLTNSLAEFIERCINGGVSYENGLYDWEDELNKINPL
ncbi:MAG: SMI1/KNR4 family protein [Bacteroidetes bacterium]|nr:SMI1/KNR4 family protein [Bacteroidota bacterium]